MKLSRQFLVFVVVGGGCTAFHYFVLVVLVSISAASPALASAIGFSASAILNYAFNRHLTFRSNASHNRAFPKFVGVALSGLGLNTALIVLLNERLGWHYMLAQIVATGVTLVWNFTFHKIWTFSAIKEEQR